MTPEQAAAIRAHVERHIGSIDAAFSRAATEGIEVLHVPPTETRSVHTFITCGVSARPMPERAGSDAPPYIELMITLPKTWQIDNPADEWQWPFKQLTELATLPTRGTALRWGQIVPNGDPPAPLGPGTKLSGAIIAPSLMVPASFYELSAAERRIAFFSVIPLYREEIAIGAQQGMEALLSKLVDHDVNDVVDPRRRNVARKFLGFF